MEELADLAIVEELTPGHDVGPVAAILRQHEALLGPGTNRIIDGPAAFRCVRQVHLLQHVAAR